MLEKLKRRFLLSLFVLWTAAAIVIMALPAHPVAADTPLEAAIAWALQIANDDSHGYSQANRWGPDYDCSSFLITALKKGGFDTGAANNTSTMKSNLMAHGFSWIPWNEISKSDLQRGDILLSEGSHTVMYIGDDQIVAAHTDRGNPRTGDQTGTEISVSAYYSDKYDGVLRFTDTVIPVTDDCDCSEDYAGNYVVTTSSDPLCMRTGHGTNYSLLTNIPRLSLVSVTKADGTWAHVSWDGLNGFCNMKFLTKVTEGVHVWDDGRITKSPSYADTGVKTYTCVICGETKDEILPMLPLDKPSAPALTATAKGVELTWNVVKGADTYNVFRKEGSGAWKSLTVVSKPSYTDRTATKNNTTYRYKVQAASGKNAGQKSSARKIVYLTTPKLTKLTKKSSTKLKVSYKKNTKATGYEIEYSRYSNFDLSLTKKVTSCKTTSKTLTGLRKKQKYYVRVRAYLKANGKTSRSCWSNVKKKKL